MTETLNYHPSILKVKEFMTDNGMSFSFSYTTQEKKYKTLQNLDKKKTCQENDIPVKRVNLISKIMVLQYPSRSLQNLVKVYV